MLRRDKAATNRAAKAKILSKPETDSTSTSDSSGEDSVMAGVFGALATAGESGDDFGAGSAPAETSLPPTPASTLSSEAAVGLGAPALRGTLAGAIGDEAGFSGVEAGLSGADAGLSGDDLGAFPAGPEAGAATIGIVAGETVAEVLGVPAAGPALRGTVCKPELAPAPTGWAIAAGRTGADGWAIGAVTEVGETAEAGGLGGAGNPGALGAPREGGGGSAGAPGALGAAGALGRDGAAGALGRDGAAGFDTFTAGGEGRDGATGGFVAPTAGAEGATGAAGREGFEAAPPTTGRFEVAVLTGAGPAAAAGIAGGTGIAAGITGAEGAAGIAGRAAGGGNVTDTAGGVTAVGTPGVAIRRTVSCLTGGPPGATGCPTESLTELGFAIAERGGSVIWIISGFGLAGGVGRFSDIV